MTFEAFVEIYYEHIRSHIRETTWETKKYIIETKIKPFFINKKINSIKPRDILKWQNEMINYRNENGDGYKPSYLKTIHNQMSSIFNFGVNFYNFNLNPAAKAGSMGSSKTESTNFWTYEEYLVFSEATMHKTMAHVGFEILYYTGIRISELLGLRFDSLDLENNIIQIKEAYHRINGKDVFTEPKTKKSKRTVFISDFLVKEIEEHVASFYRLSEIKSESRVFPVTKGYFEKSMTTIIKQKSLKRISLHGLRHSHVSYLLSIGYTPQEIAERVGHEKITTTLRYSHILKDIQRDMALDIERLRREALGEKETR